MIAHTLIVGNLMPRLIYQLNFSILSFKLYIPVNIFVVFGCVLGGTSIKQRRYSFLPLLDSNWGPLDLKSRTLPLTLSQLNKLGRCSKISNTSVTYQTKPKAV